jgi:hypothetical protein
MRPKALGTGRKKIIAQGTWHRDAFQSDFRFEKFVSIFEIFTAVKIRVVVFWIMTLFCSLIGGYQHFG